VSRNSEQRKAVLAVVRGTTCHPDAAWIYEQTRKEIPNISLGTVYRNLRHLINDGEILELETGNYKRYDGNIQNHYHFKCARCHEIYDVDLELDNVININNEVAHKTGFIVTHHYLEFGGICKRCRET